MRMLDNHENSVGTTHVNDWAQRTERQTENSNRFRHSGKGSSPLNIGDAKDGTDERPCMAYADEKDKVDNVNTPENRSI